MELVRWCSVWSAATGVLVLRFHRRDECRQCQYVSCGAKFYKSKMSDFSKAPAFKACSLFCTTMLTLRKTTTTTTLDCA